MQDIDLTRLKSIRSDIDKFINIVTEMNECAMTDRLLEKIFENIEDVKVEHNKRFDLGGNKDEIL